MMRGTPEFARDPAALPGALAWFGGERNPLFEPEPGDGDPGGASPLVALGVGAIVWTAALVACVVAPDEAAGYHLVEITLLYPAWYMWLSITRGGFDRTNG